MTVINWSQLLFNQMGKFDLHDTDSSVAQESATLQILINLLFLLDGLIAQFHNHYNSSEWSVSCCDILNF